MLIVSRPLYISSKMFTYECMKWLKRRVSSFPWEFTCIFIVIAPFPCFAKKTKTCLTFQIDIEGHEHDSFFDWFSTDVLKNVQQINFDIHMTRRTNENSTIALTKHLRGLYNLGFRIMHWFPNLVEVATMPPTFEMTLVKDKSLC